MWGPKVVTLHASVSVCLCAAVCQESVLFCASSCASSSERLPAGNRSCYLCIWRKPRSPTPNTVSSVSSVCTLQFPPPRPRRSAAEMTFYDDIYPFYPLQRTSFIFSGRLLTIILVFLVLAVSLLLILPGIRGKSVSASQRIAGAVLS